MFAWGKKKPEESKTRSKNEDAFWEGFLNWQRKKCSLVLKIIVTQGNSWRDSLVRLMGTGEESERQTLEKQCADC